MAKVVQYGPARVRQTAAAPTLERGFTAVDTTVPIQKGVLALGAGLEIRQRRVDENEAEVGLMEFEKEKNEILFNSESGYYNTKGKDAFDGEDGVKQAYDDLSKKYIDGASNQTVRDKLTSSINQHSLSDMTGISKHSSQGLDVYEQNTIKARVSSTINNATLYFNDDQQLDKNYAIGVRSIQDGADRSGMDGAALDAAMADYDSQFAAATIASALAQQDVERANELHAKNGSMLTGKAITAVQVSLDKANFDVGALQNVQEVIGDGERSLTEMVADVNAMPNETAEEAAMKTEVMRQVKQQNTLTKAIKTEGQKANYEEYGKRIQDNPNFGTAQINGVAWANMSVDQRNDLKTLEDNRDTDNHDQSQYISIMMLPDDEIVKLNPNSYAATMDESHRQLMGNKISALQSKNPPKEAAVTQSRTNIAADAIFQITNKKPAKYEPEDRAMITAINSEIDREVAAAEKANGKENLTINEYRDIVESWTSKAIIEKSFLGLIDYDSEVDISDVPPQKIKDIKGYLESVGARSDAAAIARFNAQNPTAFEDE